MWSQKPVTRADRRHVHQIREVEVSGHAESGFRFQRLWQVLNDYTARLISKAVINRTGTVGTAKPRIATAKVPETVQGGADSDMTLMFSGPHHLVGGTLGGSGSGGVIIRCSIV
jgi:hypothetical protein